MNNSSKPVILPTLLGLVTLIVVGLLGVGFIALMSKVPILVLFILFMASLSYIVGILVLEIF